MSTDIEKLNKFLEYIRKEEISYEIGEYGIPSGEIKNLITLVRSTLDNLIKNINYENVIPTQIANKYISLCDEVLINKQVLKESSTNESLTPASSYPINEVLEKLKESKINALNLSVKTIEEDPTFSSKRPDLEYYFYSDKSRFAYLVFEDGYEPEETGSEDGILELLKKCGFICTVSSLSGFSNYLKKGVISNISLSFVDFIFYYIGSGKIDNNELILGSKTHFSTIVELIQNRENTAKTLQTEKLSRKFGLRDNKEEYSKLFTVDFKKLFILDIINQGGISDLIDTNTPIFPSTNVTTDSIYLYSNIPEKINNVYQFDKVYKTPTTIFSKSIIDCINIDIENKEGRNLSTISKFIQNSVIDKLNVIKPPTEFESKFIINKENSNEINEALVNQERENVKIIFGEKITELLFSRILLNSFPIIYGDASNGDFLIYDNYFVKNK